MAANPLHHELLDRATPRRCGPESKYSEELAGKICEYIAAGNHLAFACRELGIHRSTVNRWEKEHPEFKEAVRVARIEGAWALYDQVFDISDEMVEDTSGASRQRERLRVRMWALSKMLPAVFGDKLEVEVKHRVDFDAALAAARKRVNKAPQVLDVVDAEVVPPLAIPAPAESLLD